MVFSKNTGNSPLLESMELLQEDDQSLDLGRHGLDSSASARESVGPYQICRFVLLLPDVSVSKTVSIF